MSNVLTLVCPCLNESEVLPQFYKAVVAQLDTIDALGYRILLVDDGGSDDTLTVMNQLAKHDSRVRVLSLSRNFGHQIALTAGIDHAGPGAVIMMDTDMQHPPDLLPEMIAKWREGFDIVSAVRKKTRGASWFKNTASAAFYRLVNKLSRTHIPDGVADFNLISDRVREVLTTMKERHRFVRGMISWVGFDRAFVYYDARERAAGEPKYTTWRSLGMAVDALVSFSSAPLRMATAIGIGVTAIGFLYFVGIVTRALLVGDHVVGWPSLIAVILVLGGTQILFLGLIGQYVARVFDEAKGRPLYILKQTPAELTEDESVRDE